jgi:uncharacterized protein (DUF1810 family)
VSGEAGLARFLDVQEAVYEQVLSELAAGRKRSHWMWFVFPQIAGLGSSTMARKFAIRSRMEARRYLDHEVLGARLRECTRRVLAAPGTIADILGHPDDLKFRSSMTLFSAVDPAEPLFREALDRFYRGLPDPLTLERLAEE